jgi:peptidoglycan/xylan/chitin deacetylase (PgdA/CDA1 family)
MNRRLLLICFSAVLALSGCKKVSTAIEHLRHPSEKPAPATVAAKPTPTPAPTPVAVATPTPAPIVDKHASVIALCYHRFEEKVRPNDALAITPVEFERQMQALKDAGFSVISMQDFLAWRRGEKNIPAKSALVTIDDGYVSGYDVAWPILKKFNYPFTMFVYIKYINSGGKSITWDQLAEMRDAGVDIECHSYSHENLHGKGGKAAAEVAAMGYENWLKKEISESKAIIEKQLGIKVTVFTYPFGIYNQKAREAVKAAGYEAAFTVYGQRLSTSSPYDLLGRYAIEYGKPQIFQSALDMVGGGGGPSSYSAAPAIAQVAAASMITVPAEGETVNDPKPTIKANIATMGEVEPNTLEMRISGFGLVPAQYDPKTKMVSYTCAQKLRDKNYTVILSAKVAGKKVETRWNFNFDPNGTAAPAQAPATSLPQ